MKVDAIQRHAWVASLPLSGVEKAVLRVLADHAHRETLKCWPSIETIVRESGFCKDTVLRAIRRLASKGVIDVEHSHGRTRNVYVLRVPHSPPDTPFNSPSGVPLEKGNGTSDRPQQSVRQTVNGTCDRPEPVIKPVIEPVTVLLDPVDRASLPFDLFYRAYPRHVARKKAQEVWKRKKLDGKVKVIVADVEKRKGNGCWTEREFIPYPATYLNQERWSDEDDPPPTRPPVRHAGVVL